MVEALYFGNYILSTRVGGTYDISDAEQLGKIIKIDQEQQFKEHLMAIISGDVNLTENYCAARELARNKFIWNKAICQAVAQIKEIQDGENS